MRGIKKTLLTLGLITVSLLGWGQDTLKLDYGPNAATDWVQINSASVTSGAYTINSVYSGSGSSGVSPEAPSFPSGTEDYIQHDGVYGNSDGFLSTTIEGVSYNYVSVSIFIAKKLGENPSLFINGDSIMTITDERVITLDAIEVINDSVRIEINNLGAEEYAFLSAVRLYEFAYIHCDHVTFDITGDITDAFGSEGAIDITVGGNGVTPPYTYSWSNGATTQNISGLIPGDYTVTVTDDSTCVGNETFTVAQLEPCDTTAIDIVVDSIVDIDESTPEGGIYISVTGDNPPFGYLWSNSSTNQDLTNITKGGNYRVTVTDDEGCSIDSTITLIDYTSTLGDSLYLYLPFNGNIDDESGNGYTVVNNGADLAPDRFGNPNSAYYFTDTDYMEISVEQGLPNVNEDGYSVSFWVKQDTAAQNSGYMMSYGYWNTHGGFSFQHTAGTPHTENYSILINEEPSGSSSVVFNRYNMFGHGWNMLTFSYQNGTMRGFINGSFVEEIAVAGYERYAVDFVIGNRHDYSDGITGWIDEVYVYNKALTDNEVAELSELTGAIRAAELQTYTLADFELGELEPVKLGFGWNVFGNLESSHPDSLTYIEVVENPLKTADNNTDYVGVAVTFPTNVSDLFGAPSRKMEYFINTASDEMRDHHHIMQWKAMMPDSALVDADSINWFTQNQIHGNFQLYAPPCAGTGQIATTSGGIFNENALHLESRVSKHDRLKFRFFYRAMPDSLSVYYTMDIGKWVTFTYDIFWSDTSDTGYWRLYKDGELISYQDSVKTLPECAPLDNGLQWKTGIYNRYNDYVDNEVDSITMYFDELELYVNPEDDGTTLADINPQADSSLQEFLRIKEVCDTITWSISANITDVTYYGGNNGAIVLTADAPYSEIESYSWSNGSAAKDIDGLTAGPYIVTVTDTAGCPTQRTYNVSQPAYKAPFIDTVVASNNDGNVAMNMVDDNILTRWSSVLWGAYSIFVLDSTITVDSVGIFPNSPVTRETYMQLAYSLDNVSWTNLGNDTVGGDYEGYYYRDINADARYLRLTGYGNSESGYTSIQEFKVFSGEAPVHPCDTTTIIIDSISSTPDTVISGVSQSTGSLTISSLGGDENHTYSWNGGQYTTQNLDGVESGLYSVTVTDGNNCTGSNSFTISEYVYIPPTLELIIVGTDTTLRMWSIKQNLGIDETNDRLTLNLERVQVGGQHTYKKWCTTTNRWADQFPSITDTLNHQIDTLGRYRDYVNEILILEGNTE